MLFCLMLSVSQEFSRCVLVIAACANENIRGTVRKPAQHLVRAELTLSKKITSALRILAPK